MCILITLHKATHREPESRVQRLQSIAVAQVSCHDMNIYLMFMWLYSMSICMLHAVVCCCCITYVRVLDLEADA